MSRTPTALVAAVAALALAGVTFAVVSAAAPNAAQAPSPATRVGMGMAGMGMGGMRGDVNAWFIERMIPHHESAVQMAKLALAGRAEHAELRRLAVSMQRVQRHEIAQMRAWYRRWYGREAPEVQMGMSMDLGALARARPFDAAFIEMMIPHHHQAVMMASMALRRSPRPELARLLRSIVRSQNAEINQMAAWYLAWYGRPVPMHHDAMMGPGPGAGRGPMMGAGPGAGHGPMMGAGPGAGPGHGPMMGAGPGAGYGPMMGPPPAR